MSTVTRAEGVAHTSTPHNAISRVVGKKPYHKWPFLVSTLRFADFGMLVLSGLIAHSLRFGSFLPGQAEQIFLYFSSIVTAIALQFAHAYRVRTLSSLSNQLSALFVGGAGALLTSLLCGFISGLLVDYSRIWVMLTVVTGMVLLIGNRIAMALFIEHAAKQGHLLEHIVLVGANENAQKIISSVLADRRAHARVLGVFEDRVNRAPPSLSGVPILGTTDDLLEFIRAHEVERVVVTLPWVTSERIASLLAKLRTVPVRIDLVPDNILWSFPAIEMERLAHVPLLTIANGRVDEQIGPAKRLADLMMSLVMLATASPVMLLVALAIKLDSRGPVLFRQQRHGFNNEIFNVFKFRSMTVMESEPGTVVQATKGDRRVTRVGRFLRRTSLDELPQLFNVVIGDMSVVGPRPHAIQHNTQYAEIISEYYARHNVKPGITGWAQVNGLRGETDTEEKMRRRVEYDLYYIEHWSLLFDLKIVLMTAVSVWFQDTAY